MDKTEILAEAMRLADILAEYGEDTRTNYNRERAVLESFLREHLAGQAEPVASEKLSDGELATECLCK